MILRVTILCGLVASAALYAQSGAQQPDWSKIEAETMQHYQAVLRLDTSNPPGNEHLVVDYLKQVFDKEGIPSEIFASDPEAVQHRRATEGQRPQGARSSSSATAMW
jgi:hypothetical protein